jgi:hypothetical protein
MKSAIFQAVLVVLGVILAFGANEWREGDIKRREAAEALASIREELAANREAAASSAAYHAEKLTLIGERRGAQAPLALQDFPKGFISPATLSTAAWTSAAETGALANLDYKVILDLARLYDMQEVYHNQSLTAGDIIYERMFDDGIASIPANPAGLSAFISTFLYREQALVKAYDETLGKP